MQFKSQVNTHTNRKEHTYSKRRKKKEGKQTQKSKVNKKRHNNKKNNRVRTYCKVSPGCVLTRLQSYRSATRRTLGCNAFSKQATNRNYLRGFFFFGLGMSARVFFSGFRTYFSACHVSKKTFKHVTLQVPRKTPKTQDGTQNTTPAGNVTIV